jgi:hypothetical protein
MFEPVDDIHLPGSQKVIHNFVALQRGQGHIGSAAMCAEFLTGHIQSGAKSVIDGVYSV